MAAFVGDPDPEVLPWTRVRGGLLLVAVMTMACAHAKPPVVAAKARVKLVVLAAESDAFPNIAKATTDALARAKIGSVDESTTSKVSIEVVQLSIECVDPSSNCYEAAAKSLSANKLLFAQIDVANKKPKVAVTLFDVATRAPKTTERTFDTEATAIAGLDRLVTEATQ
jgi:hypothetical protein